MHIHTIQLNIEKMLGGTVHMDAQEFGAYMSLIITCYQAKNLLPDDDIRLSRMAKCSPRIWKKIRPVLEEKFEIKDGFWSHAGVKKELVKYHSLATKNKANALKKNETQKPVGEPNASQTQANTNNNKQITNNSIKKDKDKSLSKKTTKSKNIISRIPENWDCSEELGKWSVAQGLSFSEVVTEIDSFIDHYKSLAGKGSEALDWDAKFRNWVRNRVKWKNERKLK